MFVATDSATELNATPVTTTTVPWARTLTGFTLVTLLCLGLTACNQKQEPLSVESPPRLVVLFSPCTVNRDYLSPYNPDIDFTPNLKRFALDSVVFERHVAEAAQSGVAYASLFTGTHAPSHGVYSHPTQIEDSVYLISEALVQNGYQGHYWSNHPMASFDLNYGQGVSRDHVYKKPLTGDKQFLNILVELNRDPEFKAFVMTTFTATHSPYRTAGIEKFCERYPEHCEGIYSKEDTERFDSVVALYKEYSVDFGWDYPETVKRLGLTKEEVAYLIQVNELLYKSNVYRLDEMFGSVLDMIEKRGLLGEALIVFSADHGEILHRDNSLGKWTHGIELAPETLTIPLIVRSPILSPSHRSYESVSRSMDVFPTILGLLGLEVDAVQANPDMGVDLAPFLYGEGEATDRLAFSHTLVSSGEAERTRFEQWKLWTRFRKDASIENAWVAVRDGDLVLKHRILESGEFGFVLYDLSEDRFETTNLYDPDDPSHAQLTQLLLDYHRSLIEGWYELKNLPLSDEEVLKRLRALGYIH